MIATVKAKGFRCYAEEAIFSGSREGYTHLLSLVGTREAVKAVWARLMKGEGALLVDAARSVVVRMDPQGGGKLLSERLPSGAFHGLLLSHALLRGLVLCEQEDNLPGLFYTLMAGELPAAAAPRLGGLGSGNGCSLRRWPPGSSRGGSTRSR